jgi:hypothetical protein
MKRILPVLAVIGLAVGYAVRPAAAQGALSCTASVSPGSIIPGTSTTLTFSVANGSSDTPVRWIHVVVPNDSYTIVSANLPAEWTVSPSAAELVISSNELAPGASLSVPVFAAASGNATTGESWSVSVSDDPSGNNDVTACTGSLSTVIALPTAVPSVTAAPGPAATSAPAAPTATQTPKPTPTPTPDMLPPAVTVATKLKGAYKDAPTIEGTARDVSGVRSIAYSAGGDKWQAVDGTVDGSPAVQFRFTPSDLDDGTYQLKIKTVDGRGNMGVVPAGTLTINRLPPTFAGASIAVGGVSMPVGTDGRLLGIAGNTVTVTAGVVGGPDRVSAAVADPTVLPPDTAWRPLTATGIGPSWSGDVTLPPAAGSFALWINAIDGSGQRVASPVAQLTLAAAGSITDQAGHPVKWGSVRVMTVDGHTLTPWNGSGYGLPNLVRVNPNGNYSMLLPKGRYYLDVTASSYRPIRTEIATVDTPTYVTADFVMQQAPLTWFSLFGFRWRWPFPGTVTVPWRPATIQSASASVFPSLIGRALPMAVVRTLAPAVDATSFIGRETAIVVTASWIPDGIRQLTDVADTAGPGRNVVGVLVGDPESAAESAARRGRFGFPTIGDPTAGVPAAAAIGILPTTIILDRTGTVTDIITGYRPKEGTVWPYWK